MVSTWAIISTLCAVFGVLCKIYLVVRAVDRRFTKLEIEIHLMQTHLGISEAINKAVKNLVV